MNFRKENLMRVVNLAGVEAVLGKKLFILILYVPTFLGFVKCISIFYRYVNAYRSIKNEKKTTKLLSILFG